MTRKRKWIRGGAVVVLAVALLALINYRTALRYGHALTTRIHGRHTVDDPLAQYGTTARERMRPYFDRAAVPYPPQHLVLVGVKQDRQLLVYVGDKSGEARFIRSYPVLGASGELGPKLREGDRQVPEGIYRIELLNPNSLFHLSLRIGYPNEFDRARAKEEGRTNLGGDIMIHGGRVSVGCLAMGDEAAEELFVLAAEAGIANIEVILCPVDFRRREMPPADHVLPKWTDELYGKVRERIAGFVE